VRLALTPTGTGGFYESNGRARALPARLADPALQDRAWAHATPDGRFPRSRV
jgi:hypothetical protein